MEHPCYTSINPAAEAHRYTSEKVQVRKVTFIYDWLDPDRDVKSWFRRVPYHLEKGVGHRSWIVRYFEFRAKVFPVPQMGFVGDLWICWDVTDPSIWFKVDETTWERWVGCASSVREQMDAKHPFLDKAYLWFDPIDYFFTDPKRSGGRVSLRWERSQRIRRVAPASRIVGPGCDTPPKKGPLQSVRLPTMRTIVGEMCPHMPQPVPKPRSVPMTPDVDRQRGSRHSLNIATSRVHVVDPCGPFPNEDIAIGSDVEIDWDWWGSTDDEARDEITQVGNSQPPHLSPTPTPPPVTPAERSRYHPYTSPTPSRFTRFKPPRRYTQGALDPTTPLGTPYNTPAPASSFSSTSSTAVGSTANPVSTESGDSVVGLQDCGPLPQCHLRKLSRWTLRRIMMILREDDCDQSGTCILILPDDVYDLRRDLAAELHVPVLDLGTQTSHKIQRLLSQHGFTQPGILILRICNPNEGG